MVGAASTSQLRPGTDTIGCLEDFSTVLLATGHYRNGVLLFQQQQMIIKLIDINITLGIVTK